MLQVTSKLLHVLLYILFSVKSWRTQNPMVRAMDAGLNRYMYNNLFDNLNIKICNQRDD